MGREQSLCVRYEPVRGPPERLRFEPRSDGRYARFEEFWNGCVWAVRGHDVVDEVALDATADAIAALRDGS